MAQSSTNLNHPPPDPTILSVQQELEELRQREKRFRAIAEFTYDWESWHTPTGKLEWVNSAVERLTGWSVQECLNRPDYPLFLVAVEDQPRIAAMLDAARAGQAGNDLEFRIVRRDGETRWGAISWQSVCDDGVCLGFRTSVRDITDRVRATVEIRKNAERLQLAVQAKGIGLGDWDLQTGHLHFNPEWMAHVGYRPGELEENYSAWKARVHPDDLTRMRPAVRKLIDGQENACEVEYRFRHRNGNWLWIRASGEAVRDATGRVVRIVGCHVDITDRKQSEERLRRFIEQAPASIAMFDQQMRYLAVSQRWVQTFETQVNLVGRSHYEVSPEIPAHWKAAHERGLTGETVRCAGETFVRADGKIQTVSWEVLPWHTDEGEIGGILIGADDITARAQAEKALQESQERLQLAVQNARIGLGTWDLHTDSVVFEPGWKETLGYTDAEIHNNWASWSSLFHPDDLPRINADIQRAIQGPQDICDIAFRMRHKNGSWRSIQSLGKIIRDEAGVAVRLIGCHIDVTDRTRSEERLRVFVENAPANLAMFDRNMCYVAASRRWCDQHHLPADPAGRCHYDLLDDIPPRWREAHRRGLAGESISSAREPYARSDGTMQWVSWQIVPWRNTQGEIGGILIGVEDITSRIEAEQALQASEERLRLAIQVSRIGLGDWDLRTNKVILSREWKAMLGYEEDEIRDELSEWEQRIHPEERAAIVTLLQRAIDGQGDFHDVEFRMQHRDGSWRWILARADIIRDAEGQPLRLLGCNIDITTRKSVERTLEELNNTLEQQVARRTGELQEREERLHSILQTARDAIITIDQSGSIQSVNPSTERLFGFTAAELLGQNVNMLMPSPYSHLHDSYLRRYRETGEKRIIGIGREAVARRKDGSLFPIELAVSEIPGLGLYTGFIHDISQRKHLEREIVEIASDEQRRIGHELHDSVVQELLGLSLLADHIRATPPDDSAEARVLLEQLGTGLRRCQEELHAVMRGLLPVTIDSRGLMAALSGLAKRTSGSGEVTCQFVCPQAVSVADNLTATHLFLIAQEAVRNAVKHSQPRRIVISLKADDFLTLSVEDDGSGLASDPTRQAQAGGAGLHIMRSRAGIIGANLSIIPVYPQGTRVLCLLPFDQDAPHHSHPA